MHQMAVSFSIADSSNGPRKVVIWVTGELDADTARAVRARLGQAQRHARSDVILDMTGVTYVDSSGVAAIVNGARALSDAGKLRVISPHDRVAQLLEDAGLGEIFELVKDRREKVDRRRRSVAVAVDRRKGGDRRFQGRQGDTPPQGTPNPVGSNGI
jgi:anti-sigma B factor antagonist